MNWLGECKNVFWEQIHSPFHVSLQFYSSDRLNPWPGPEQRLPWDISADRVQCQVLWALFFLVSLNPLAWAVSHGFLQLLLSCWFSLPQSLKLIPHSDTNFRWGLLDLFTTAFNILTDVLQSAAVITSQTAWNRCRWNQKLFVCLPSPHE